jgi:ArsR family transcriptional regulator, arsenate/arsenite/antimonite-responsive transcriptional repressor
MTEDATLVRVLKAVGHAKRFRMIREIGAAGELSCGQIGNLFDLSQPTISHHLKILVEAGVLVVRESGQHRFVSVNLPLLNDVAWFLPGRLQTKPSRPNGTGTSRAPKEKGHERSGNRVRKPRTS